MVAALGKPSTVISQEASDEKTKYNSVEDGGGYVQNGSDIETNNNPHVSPQESIERKSMTHQALEKILLHLVHFSMNVKDVYVLHQDRFLIIHAMSHVRSGPYVKFLSS